MCAIFALVACIILGAPIELYGLGAVCAVWDLFRAAEARRQLRLLEAQVEELEMPAHETTVSQVGPRHGRQTAGQGSRHGIA